MKLKEIDRKILTHIYHNRNPSLSKVAKELNISRDQVDYRIKKYLSEGLIKKFFTFFNYPAFGYNYLALLYLKFEKSSQIEKFLVKLNENKNVISHGKCFAKYDVYINVIFKNENEMSKFFFDLLSSEETSLSDYLILKPYLSEFYPLKFIDSQRNEEGIFSLSEKVQEKKFDEKDIKIMKMLNKNAWERITNIAYKTKSSPEQILYRIKRLEKEKVILGTRIQFDLSKLSYFATVFLINLPNLSNTIKSKLKNFVKSSPNINSFYLSFSKPNCLIQIFHKNEKEMRDTLDKLKETFKDDYISIEILPLEEELEGVNTLPFL